MKRYESGELVALTGPVEAWSGPATTSYTAKTDDKIWLRSNELGVVLKRSEYNPNKVEIYARGKVVDVWAYDLYQPW